MKYYLFMDFADGTTESVHAPFNSPEDAWNEKTHVIESLRLSIKNCLYRGVL